ncbi:MAG TPA: helix-turn-helix transcriptional regulator, partial [Nocardioides sp.]|nr:helix-turn-helix transcriptional regulator [Nocardioides sp.]
DLAEQTGNPAYVTGIQAFLTALRSEVEDRDRQSVAAEIRRLIASTNCTQGQFARRVGTSASRISTYATGAVTPGASMFLRIRRTAERLVAEQAAADHQLAARARGGAAGAPSRPFPPYGHLGGGGPRAGERRAGSLS